MSDLFGTTSLGNSSQKSTQAQASGLSGLESLAATDMVLVINASGNTQEGWSDTLVRPNGQMALNEEILKSFCDPKCPQGKVKIGISFAADLLNKPKEVVLKELQALVTGAKANGFYFLIHANHEWVFTPNTNPFGGESADWAEYTDWNTPLKKFYVAWAEVPPEIGLKPNYHTPLVRKKTRADIEEYSKFIREKILMDSEAHRLFLGVDVGWETEVTPWVTPENKSGPLGYAALAAKGFSSSNPPKDFQQELGNIAREFSDFVVQTYETNGISRKYLFSHIVAIDKPSIEKRNPLDVAKLLDINLGVSAFGAEFDIPRIYKNMTKNWAITETDPKGALYYATNLPSTPPRFITVYAWGDNIRNNPQMITSYKALLNNSSVRKIYRLYGKNDGTHLFSFGPDEGEKNSGYQRNGHAFTLATQPSEEAQKALYRCLLLKAGNQIEDRMLSVDSNCEGYKTEALLGYMTDSPSKSKQCVGEICYESRPLFRCYNQARNKHLSTLDQNECLKYDYKVEGISGHVWGN